MATTRRIIALKQTQTDKCLIVEEMMKSSLFEMHFNPIVRGRKNEEVKRSCEEKINYKYTVH